MSMETSNICTKTAENVRKLNFFFIQAFSCESSLRVGFLHFDALENPIIFARSTDYRSNYFFRYSKLRKSVKTAEKAT